MWLCKVYCIFVFFYFFLVMKCKTELFTYTPSVILVFNFKVYIHILFIYTLWFSIHIQRGREVHFSLDSPLMPKQRNKLRKVIFLHYSVIFRKPMIKCLLPEAIISIMSSCVQNCRLKKEASLVLWYNSSQMLVISFFLYINLNVYRRFFLWN